MNQPFIEASRGAWWAMGAAAVAVTLGSYYIGLENARRSAENSKDETQQMLAAAQINLAESTKALTERTEELRKLHTRLNDMQSATTASDQSERADLNQRIAHFEFAIVERDRSLREALTEIDRLKSALARAEAEVQRVARAGPSTQRIRGLDEPADSPPPQSSPVNLAALVGRWVGVAACTRGNYPTSISIKRATSAELSVTYSDSLNSSDTEATLVLVSDGPSDPEFVFRTRDDRFIALKNGNKLQLSSGTRLVSPENVTNQCKLVLRRS